MKNRQFASLCLTLLFLSSMLLSCAKKEPLYLLSDHKVENLESLCKDFERETKIPIKLLSSKEETLLNTVKTQTTIDMVLLEKQGRMLEIETEDLLEKLSIESSPIPKHFLSADNRWVALSFNPITIVYNSDSVWKDDLKSFKNLAETKWQNRLCLKDESDTLFKDSMKSAWGEKNYLEILSKIEKNKVSVSISTEEERLKQLSEGGCDLSIMPLSYLADFLFKNENAPLTVFWPEEGAPYTLTSIAILQSSQRKEDSKKFIRWITEKSPSYTYAHYRLEYPTNSDAPPGNILKSWGPVQLLSPR